MPPTNHYYPPPPGGMWGAPPIIPPDAGNQPQMYYPSQDPHLMGTRRVQKTL